MKRWYVVNTQPRAEVVALANLRRQGFEAWLPRYRKLRRHARKVEPVSMPLFPCYLFVALDAEDRWRSINGTTGCRKLVALGEEPTPLAAGVVEALQAEADDEGFVDLGNPLARLHQGAPLRIVDGPMAELIGQFQRLDDSQRVVLLLDLLGRRVEVRIPLRAVEAA